MANLFAGQTGLEIRNILAAQQGLYVVAFRDHYFVDTRHQSSFLLPGTCFPSLQLAADQLSPFSSKHSLMKQRLPLRLAAIALTFTLTVSLSRAPAQDRGVGVRIKTGSGQIIKLYDRSYALVIGVTDYTAGWPRLPGVKKDVEEVSRALEKHDFRVTKVENPDSQQMEKSFKEFIDQYGRSADHRLLFYFAGHGYTLKQSYGEEMGYIVPTDAPIPARDQAGFMSKAMSMEQIELYAKRVQSKHALFLFDSCFSGSFFARAVGVPESIGYKTSLPVRQFITSGSAEETVPDQSVFRRQFIEAIEGEADVNKDEYVTGTELGMFLQDKVINYSKNAQHPQYGKIRNPNLDKGDFVFALPKASSAMRPSTAQIDGAAVEQMFWNSIQASTSAEDFRAYLKEYPSGRFAPLARNNLRRLETATNRLNVASPCPTVIVSCPDIEAAGNPVTFTANVSGGDPAVTPTFNWAVSAGAIARGQGTDSILIFAPGETGTVTATVDVSGYERRCLTSASCTTTLLVRAVARKMDAYGNIKFCDEEARLDNFAIELQDNPGAEGYIIFYDSRHTKTDEAQRHAERALSYLVETRGIDRSRVAVANGGLRESLMIELWLIPVGAVPP